VSNHKFSLGQPFSRRSVLKAGSAAAAFCATGIAGKSYQRALAQDDVDIAEILAETDLERLGELCLQTTKQGAFTGQTVRFQGILAAGAHIEVLRPVTKAWEEATGATVEWIGLNNADSYPKLNQALSTDTVAFDVLEGSAGWEGDLFGGDHCLPMPEEVKGAVDFDDIVDYLQSPTRTWNGTVYGMSIDGDCHHFNYRKDIFSDGDLAAEWAAAGGEGDWTVPTTWQQVQAVTQFMAGKSFEGQPIYGYLDTCAPGGGTGNYFFNSRASAYVKHPDDPSVFFDPDTMEPRINRPPFVRALQDIIDALPGEPPDQRNSDFLKAFGDFLAGTGSMLAFWADVGPNIYANPQSIVQERVGFSILPGSPEVYNWKTDAWDTISSAATPSPGGAQGANSAPYLAFLGWGLYVMKEAEAAGVAEAAWDLVTHLTSKPLSLWMVTHNSGYNPWRKSHFNAMDWTTTGFPEADAQQYLDSIADSYNHPNRIIDLRIPGLGQYWQEAEAAWTRAVAGELEPQAALDQAATRWNEITDTLGRENQLKLYQASLQ
jgi:multiple sugar transport system substrate-binding protein